MEIEICEVGPRDGLQNEKKLVSTEGKLKLIVDLIEAGCKNIEVTSFVNPKIVPQMADAEQLIAVLPKSDVIYSALILSNSGLTRALKTTITNYNIVMAVSDGFNLKNARRTAQQSMEELGQVVQTSKQSAKYVNVTLGTAFGCPYDGEIPLHHVLATIEHFLLVGADEITLADTTGLANPLQVEKVVKEVFNQFGRELKLGLHFHNTRGLGMANALAGLQNGVTRFDSSIAGIGGCPFAPKAAGNICTDDLVFMLHEMGHTTTIDLSKLVYISKWLEQVLERKLDGMYMKTV